MDANQYVIHSHKLSGDSGELLNFSREAVRWEWMSLTVKRLAPREVWEVSYTDEEAAQVLLSGKCDVDWGTRSHSIGARKNVFDGLPYALYLAPGDRARYTANTVCEIADCRVPAEKKFPSRLVTPRDVTTSLRGGGNASRQIVDVMPVKFPAVRLVVVEVYTPGGNWSSYPPHKHDVSDPPREEDLDEIYYYRTNHAAAFAHQRLYKTDGTRDMVVTAKDGDAVLIHDGYHPVVAGPGYDVYYLNFIAGKVRSHSNTEDPQHDWIRAQWKEVDSRLPMIRSAGSGD